MENKIVEDDMEYIGKNVGNAEKFDNSTILVTGCAGFLGFYFMEFFCRLSRKLKINSIIGLDNFKLGRPAWLEGLEKKHKDRLEIHSFDISRDDLAGVKNAENADFVIHMASIASPAFYRKYPLETVDANVWGIRKLLDYYKNRRLRGFLFFSSSEAYGDPAEDFIPTPEEYRGNVSQIGPRACYDESKRFGETLCYIFANRHAMPIVIVRPFNNYGPGMRLDDGRAPADFARSVVGNEDIVVYSDGSPKRTFCYVADAVVGYLKALTYGKFDYFNIGADKPEVSIKELAEMYASAGRKIMGYNGSVKFEASADPEYLTNNPARRCPDITKARKLLGFNPQVEVNEGVGRFLEFVKPTGGKL